MHLPKLIYDLMLILSVSGLVSILFRWLKQPITLGYLIAGALVGPYISSLPTVVEVESVKIWGELGVIYLLFVLGLEFSFRKLFRVGKAALIASVFEVSFMMAIGFVIGWALNWTYTESLFLGGILAISSTTIIVKAFEESGIKTQSFASLVFGILIIEDLLAIVILTLLTTTGASSQSEEISFFKQMAKLFGILFLVLPAGLWLVPKFLKLIQSQLNDETRVIVSVALCLSLVSILSWAGFSPALGAFLMGAFIGETSEGERMERLLKPIRDLFGAIFFTSVGMLVDFQSILSHFKLVVGLSIITILGKVFSTTMGAILAGQDRRTAWQAGMSLGQIGEFSFIMATLGLSMGVIRPELYPLSVSVALITTFLTPYLIRIAVNPKRATSVRLKTRSSSRPKFSNGHLIEFEIHPHFSQTGESLEKLNLRHRFGISIVAIHRGDLKMVGPGKSDILMPFDRIIVFGSDEQLAAFEGFLRSERKDDHTANSEKFSLEKIIIQKESPFIGKSLKSLAIGEKTKGIVLGIERKKEHILNPDSQERLNVDDILWVYASRQRLKPWSQDFSILNPS